MEKRREWDKQKINGKMIDLYLTVAIINCQKAQ
jgi:hypothetical protein